MPSRSSSTVHPPAPVQGRIGSMMGELGANTKEGFGLGTGIVMAQRMVSYLMGPLVICHEAVASSTPSAPSAATEPSVTSLMGPLVIRHEAVASSTPSAPSAATEPSVTSSGALNTCDTPSKALVYCLNNFGNEISRCQFYMDALIECHKNTGALSA